jgi:hypothetical protein
VEGGGFPTLPAEFDELRNLRRPCPRAPPSPYESGSLVQFTILAVVEQRSVGRRERGKGREEMDVEKVRSSLWLRLNPFIGSSVYAVHYNDFLCKGEEPVEMQALHPLFAAAN